MMGQPLGSAFSETPHDDQWLRRRTTELATERAVGGARDDEIAASVGAYRDLGPAYDDAIAAGLVERIGAEVDRRVDERISRFQDDAQPSAAGSRRAQRRTAGHSGGPLSWSQAFLAFGSMVIGAIASGINASHGGGPVPILVIWTAIVVINIGIFRTGRRP
jgi:hypothetical protein